MKIFIVTENQKERTVLEQYDWMKSNIADEKEMNRFLSHLKHLKQESQILVLPGNESNSDAEHEKKDDPNQTFSAMDLSKKLSVPFDSVSNSGNISRFEFWVHQFMTNRYENALQEMLTYIDSLKQNPDTIEIELLQFLIKFSYHIKVFISENNFDIPYHSINDELGSRFAVCTHSIENMKNWLNDISQSLQPYRSQTQFSYTAVERVQQYIKKNLKNNIPRTELASLVYLHPDYLSHIFRRQTGKSLQEYIMEERILKAKYLLLHTTLNVSAIALECGYENAAYFSKIFKKLVGKTPKAFKSDEKKLSQ